MIAMFKGPGFDNHVTLTSWNDLALRKYILKYVDIISHGLCSLFQMAQKPLDSHTIWGRG